VQAEGDERKVGYYIRVSTERQARVVEGSLKNQRQMLETELERRNAQSPGWGAFVDAYVDEGLSGKNTNRPAFQRMMQDLEIGRIDTVMFTELSRLSRSLKDFLNIFESAQKHQCDLVCLKTDIDTTSPYKSLITKILMIFAEFEREMTSRRTSANAYERSKRGLANGGVAPLGYRRDKKRKGYLIVDPVESHIVQAIFTTYLKEHSIKRTAEKVGKDHRSLKLTRSKVHSILTSKAYIGVRAIYERDAANAQEVPAVWEPIIAKAAFDKVQAALRTNRERYHRYPDRTRYAYLFSGLLRCGACGEALHGRSAWSSTRKRHHYYVHHTACPRGGLTRIDAEVIHKIVLDWLRDIAGNGERFEKLRQEGVKRIRRRITELRRECSRIDAEQTALSAEIESRIRELTRTKADPVRRSIEASITKLETDKEQKAQERLYVVDEIGTLETLTAEKELFKDYQEAIQSALAAMGSGRDPRTAIAGILASLTLFPDQMKAALSAVNLKEPRSRVSVLAPPAGLEPAT
jgi:site-specific DNA recombinase